MQSALDKHEQKRLKNINLIANAELDRQKLIDEEQIVLDDIEKIAEIIFKPLLVFLIIKLVLQIEVPF